MQMWTIVPKGRHSSTQRVTAHVRAPQTTAAPIPQAASEHYRIPLATVYGALAFYYDNEEAIHEAIRQARELVAQLGARSAQDALDALRARNYALKRLSIDLSFDTIFHWPACPRTNTGPIFPKASVKVLAFSP